MSKTANIAALVASLAAGEITAEHIHDAYGDSVLSAVLGGVSGLGVGAVVAGVTKTLIDETGIGDVVDDIFGGIF